LVVLVVGGAGYVGSHAAHALRSGGHDAVIYDNLSTGHRSLVDGFELMVGEIADRAKLSSVLRRVDAVMHFAGHAYVGESVENPRKYFRNNVEAALALLNTCVDSGVRRIIFSSSCTVYGIPSKIPIAEDASRRPVSAYGASKLFFEHALEAYDRAYGVKYVALRYFNAAGADESGMIGELHRPETHLIPSALQAVRGERAPLELFGKDYPTPDGTCIRDYIHVNDLAEAHGLALRHLCDGKNSMALNLGTGHGYSVAEVLKKVEEVTGHSVPVRIAPRRPGDPPSLVADPSGAEKMLRWKARRSLDDMVRSAWGWMGRWQQWERSA
jgi:UDP-glucose-4-epimerase GalE